LDVTEALQKLLLGSEAVSVTVLPVRKSKDEPEPKPLNIEKIELYVR
jgi:hypothetical protein